MKTKLIILTCLLLGSTFALKAQVKTFTIYGRATSAAIVKDANGKETVSILCDGKYQKEKCYTYTIDENQHSHTTIKGRYAAPTAKKVTISVYENGIPVVSFSGVEMEPPALGESATFVMTQTSTN